MYPEQDTATLPEACISGYIKHTQLFLKLQKVTFHEGEIFLAVHTLFMEMKDTSRTWEEKRLCI